MTCFLAMRGVSGLALSRSAALITRHDHGDGPGRTNRTTGMLQVVRSRAALPARLFLMLCSADETAPRRRWLSFGAWKADVLDATLCHARSHAAVKHLRLRGRPDFCRH